MKKILLFLVAFICANTIMASSYDYFSFKTTDGSITTIKSADLEMNISNGNLIVSGSTEKVFPIADLSSMYFSTEAGAVSDVETIDTEVQAAEVTVVWNGSNATVTMTDNVKNYVTSSVSGGNVTLTQAATVGETTTGEIKYILSGSSTNGSFVLNGSYKATISLQGHTLTNPSGAAINIQNGKRIELSVKNSTTNTLTDGTGGDWKGALMCKGHLELKGKGTLDIYGNTAHAIWSKEYYEQKNCTVNIHSAVKDGVNCNQYFLMESGTLNISGFGDDGIQVGIKDATAGDAEDTGNFVQTDGTINIYMKGASGEGVKYEGEMKRTGGELNIIEDNDDTGNSLNNAFTYQETVDIYTVLGQYIGTFTYSKALNSLHSGIYVAKGSKETHKIIVK